MKMVVLVFVAIVEVTLADIPDRASKPVSLFLSPKYRADNPWYEIIRSRPIGVMPFHLKKEETGQLVQLAGLAGKTITIKGHKFHWSEVESLSPFGVGFQRMKNGEQVAQHYIKRSQLPEQIRELLGMTKDLICAYEEAEEREKRLLRRAIQVPNIHALDS